MTEKPFTVAQFIEFLKTQPQDALVEVVEVISRSNWDDPTFVNFNPEKHSYLLDFTKSNNVGQYSGKKVLEIGAK